MLKTCQGALLDAGSGLLSSKSRIRNLQSIGRVLRKGNRKTRATLYDIADDISYKSRRNYTLNHLIERIKVYNEENFNYDIVNIPSRI